MALEKFLERENYIRQLFGETILTAANDAAEIADLIAIAMSPENLTCDGELSGDAVVRRKTYYQNCLKELQSA